MDITGRCEKPGEYEDLVSALEKEKLLKDSIPENSALVCENCSEAKGLIKIHAPSGLTDRGTFV